MISPTDSGFQLARGDSCPFLEGNGECKLHSTEIKPLICRLYPLIIFKYDKDGYLVWIDPCRGNSFYWNAAPTFQISNREIEELIKAIQPYISSYIGDEYDKGNPYTNIPRKRLLEEANFFNDLSKSNNLVLPALLNITKSYLQSFSDFFAPLETKRDQKKELSNTIESVIYWLSWSPVGLQLSFINAKIIFSLAASWIYSWSTELDQLTLKPLAKSNFYNKMGSILATAILPSFWYQFKFTVNDKELKELSTKIIQVLKGRIPQEDLLG